MIVDRYYYEKLPESEKKIYREIYHGYMAHKDIIQISATEEIANSFIRITRAVTDDNPLLYFLNQTMVDLAEDAYGNVAVLPQYFFPTEKVTIYNQRMQDAANRIIEHLRLTEGSESEKIRKVHDYMCRNVVYDYGGSDVTDVSRVIYSHNITGVFAHKKAQCEGIAKAAKVLLNAVDVPCIVAFGQARNQKDVMADHCWNIVQIKGQPYHMDITFDIGAAAREGIAYDYYLITDSQIRKDHVFSTGLPRCSDKQASFFEQEGLIFSSKRLLKDYVARQVKQNAGMVYFKLSGKLKAREIADSITDYALHLFLDRGMNQITANQVINDVANTCRITFR